MFNCPHFGKALSFRTQSEIAVMANKELSKLLSELKDVPDENSELVDLEDQTLCGFYKTQAEWIMYNEKFGRIVLQFCQSCQQPCQFAKYDLTPIKENPSTACAKRAWVELRNGTAHQSQ